MVSYDYTSAFQAGLQSKTLFLKIKKVTILCMKQSFDRNSLHEVRCDISTCSVMLACKEFLILDFQIGDTQSVSMTEFRSVSINSLKLYEKC